MIGIDEAHFRFITATASRLVDFPDNLSRHITLTNWEWQVADWVEAAQGYGKGVLAECAYEHALESCDAAVLRIIQPPECKLPDSSARLQPLCENREDITGQARRAFEAQIRESFRFIIGAWMSDCTGCEHAPANDRFGAA